MAKNGLRYDVTSGAYQKLLHVAFSFAATAIGAEDALR